MPPGNLRKQLISYWVDTLSCRDCDLPRGYDPQFRPVGQKYRVGGVAFLQINPGYGGQLTKKEIDAKYKTKANRDVARLKRKTAAHLHKLQKVFIDNACMETCRTLSRGYHNAMSTLWGWPPGIYARTIERHGADLDSVAIVNVAHCPVPQNKYSNKLLSACWHKRTARLVKILKPKIIVAQGKIVFCLLNKLNIDQSVTILEGVHHASRLSKEVKKRLFNKVRKKIAAL